MNEPEVTLRGYAVEDPVRRLMRSGDWFTSFRFASTPRRYDSGTGKYLDGETLFATVSAFRGLRRGVEESVRKGQPLVVHGRLRVRTWSRGERRGQEVDIDALSLGHDLSQGSAQFRRHDRAESQGGLGESLRRPPGGYGSATAGEGESNSDRRTFRGRGAPASPRRAAAPVKPIDPGDADTDPYLVSS
ncbi:single-stranded DNA-binding protein [Gephyromycinifex aptenodytis]|uniref:single-stranded DNA-binding protein n=1 Tax=Gephyromycinifex aptenodytis TaxID=2716227 RepID=UPI00144695CC|nr:single-stranded DNA-binding protein [Gephyromycinifex aptenodytis]